MSPLSTLLVLCGLAAYSLQVSSTEVLRPIQISGEFMCMEEKFPENHVCKVLFPNHNSIMVPNPSQILDNGILRLDSLEDYFNASLDEFKKVSGLLTRKDQCSDKIATLLCFFYFPSCNIVETNSKNETFTTFPCKSLCEEVTALDSECTKIIPNNIWGPHFHGCNLTYGEAVTGQTRQVYSDGQCANASHPSYYQIQNCKKINSTLDVTSSCKSNCKYRRNPSKKLFINNNYNFAIKCTVNSVSTQGPFGKEVINCTINKQFPVKARGSCTKAPELEDGVSILIFGYSSSCSTTCFSSLEANNQYIIAGTYIARENCNDTLWYVKYKDFIVETSTSLENKFKYAISRGNGIRGC